VKSEERVEKKKGVNRSHGKKKESRKLTGAVGGKGGKTKRKEEEQTTKTFTRAIKKHEVKPISSS
jgi:hypothetical protein